MVSTDVMSCFDGDENKQNGKKSDLMFFGDDIQKNYLKANGKSVLGLKTDADTNNRIEVKLFLKQWLYNG